MPIPLTRSLGWEYDWHPATGFTYQLNPDGNVRQVEPPRTTTVPFSPPDPGIMRDLTAPVTYPYTGGAPQVRPVSFRPMEPPIKARTLRRRKKG